MSTCKELNQSVFSIALQWDTPPSEAVLIQLKEDPSATRAYSSCPSAPKGLALVHRRLEGLYRGLPWPSEVRRICVFTEIKGGFGDVSAAAKVIQLMHKVAPTLQFLWILDKEGYKPGDFLKQRELMDITIEDSPNWSRERVEADLFINGPANPSLGADYLGDRFNVKLDCPRFNFLENATSPKTKSCVWSAYTAIKNPVSGEPRALHLKMHEIFFSNPAEWSSGLIMGLEEGSGVFLDESRLTAPRSQEHCCPSYLLQLEEERLKEQILASLGVTEDALTYGKSSFNSGYAHRQTSWARFIDFVALHEQEKNVVILLNQRGYFDSCTTAQFAEQVFTAERLATLQRRGYGSLRVEDSEEEIEMASGAGRRLVVILRPSFSPNDMKNLQLASERLLATGDNTAAEAWAARCKLYLYENVANGGCKTEFLEQQIAVAGEVFPELATLLRLFGTLDPLSQAEEEEVERILRNPLIAEKTVALCRHITESRSFAPLLEGALKRTAWHHVLPELMRAEAGAIDFLFLAKLVGFLKDAKGVPRTAKLTKMGNVAEKIQSLVHTHVNASSAI